MAKKKKQTGARYWGASLTWTPKNRGRPRRRRHRNFYSTAEPYSSDLAHAAIQALAPRYCSQLWDAIDDVIGDGDDRCHAIANDHTGEWYWDIYPALTAEELAAKNAEPYHPPNQRPKKPKPAEPPAEPIHEPSPSLFDAAAISDEPNSNP
jgi:hypothetical protein